MTIEWLFIFHWKKGVLVTKNIENIYWCNNKVYKFKIKLWETLLVILIIAIYTQTIILLCIKDPRRKRAFKETIFFFFLAKFKTTYSLDNHTWLINLKVLTQCRSRQQNRILHRSLIRYISNLYISEMDF